MSGELWAMARNGTTLLPSEAQKLAAAYDALQAHVHGCEAQLAALRRRAERTERTLAALRQPSEAVLDAAHAEYPFVRQIVCAAVAAAEREP